MRSSVIDYVIVKSMFVLVQTPPFYPCKQQCLLDYITVHIEEDIKGLFELESASILMSCERKSP